MKIKRKLSTMENLKYQTIKDVINNKISKERAAWNIATYQKNNQPVNYKIKKRRNFRIYS